MAELESLRGRVYAITGGSKGMGLRYARALTAEGAHVAMLARPSADLDAAAAEMPDALALPCDIGSPAEVRRAFAAIAVRHGRLDGLINNAGAVRPHLIAESTDEEIRAQLDTNLVGPILCIREAFPLLKAAGRGDIVNVSSESVRIPFPMLTLYAASKAALETMSQGLREEMRPFGIRVTVLRVGQVGESSLSLHWSEDRAQQFNQAIIDGGQKNAAPMSPETTALMLVNMLRLPREANIDLIELRAF